MKKVHITRIFIILFLISNLASTVFLLNKNRFIGHTKDKIINPELSNGNINIQTPENKTYTLPMRGYYPATYGFESEIDGTLDLNIKFIDSIYHQDTGTSVTIIPSLNGHNKVLKLSDINPLGYINIDHYMDSIKTDATIEFWLATSSITTSQGCIVGVKEGSTHIFRLIIDNNDLEDALTNTIKANFIQINTFFHVKISLDDTLNVARVFVDGVNEGTFPYEVNTVVGVDRIYMGTGSNDIVSFYFDAIGCSWDPYYSIGDNLYEGLLLGYNTYFTPDWMGYSLDNQSNITIIGNTTISTPDRGIHTLQVYANDSIGTMYSSDIRYFSINYQSQIFVESFDTITYESLQSNATGWGSGAIFSEFKHINILDVSYLQNADYFELEKSGDYVYVISSDGLSVINVVDPVNPILISEYNFINEIYSGGIYIDGNYAYLAAAENGLLIFDISNPELPFLEGSIDKYRYGGYIVDVDLYAVDVVVSGNYAYVAGDDHTPHAVIAINVVNPSEPQVVSYCLYDYGWWMAKLAINENNIYLTTYGIIDISNPSGIYPRGSFDPNDGGGYPDDVELDNSYAYVLGANLYILDLSNPDDLNTVATYECSGLSIYKESNYLYISAVRHYNQVYIDVLDISNPINPLSIYTSKFSSDYGFISMSLSENILYGTLYLSGILVSVNVSNVGQYEYSTIAESKTINSIGFDFIFKEFYLLVDEILEAGTSIQYYLSVDNGIHWEEIDPNIHYEIQNKGNELKWKANFTTSNPYHKPTLNSLTIIYTYKKLLEAPNLIKPLNNTLMNVNEISFEWESVLGTTYYLIEIDASSDFNSLNLHRYYSQNNFLSNISLLDGQWYYRIVANDSDGDLGLYSETRNFIIDTVPPDIPSLNSPSNNTIINKNVTTFSWSSVSDAQNYTLQLDISNFFETPSLITIDGITSTSHLLTTELTEGIWYWRVYAYDTANNQGPYSSYFRLIVDTTGPNAPSLILPTNNVFTNDNTPLFSWSSVSDAQNYTLQMDTSISFSSINLIIVAGIISINYTPISALSDNIWYWRLCAVDSIGNQGVFSNPINFTIDTLLPSIDNPLDKTYKEGSIGNSITWNPSDSNPYYFIITKDGISVDNGSWDGSVIVIQVDGLTPGDYIYNCTVIDKAGNYKSDTVMVKVLSQQQPNLLPIIIGTSVAGIIAVISIPLIIKKLKRREK